MGAHNVAAALGVEVDKITPRARLVLVAMAYHARDSGTDEAPAGVYYGGAGLLAATLGMYPSEVALHGIIRDVAQLRAVGVVERLDRAAGGRHATYRLVLPVVDKRRKSVDNPP
jgi:hypothetical protein